MVLLIEFSSLVATRMWQAVTGFQVALARRLAFVKNNID